jgi:hypothetical protein
MENLVLEPTAMAQWYSLISEAQKASAIKLNEDIESYLVFLLLRFEKREEIVASILASEYLNSLDAPHRQRYEILREVGDKCLLFTGLFPGQAQRHHVGLEYFIQLGQNSYGLISDLEKQQIADLFKELHLGFISMMEVLHSVRQLQGAVSILQPLQAAEVWGHTGSPHALKILQQYSPNAFPVKVARFPGKPH